ncbi:MAG: EVE domain-containing protein [Phycisphaerae bacterium]|nr:EVE domain-containing protein [Phycisphaerae bacterium]
MAKSSPSEQCWLLKTEPDCYSIDDLARDKRTRWTGVRNYQARNFMRDEMSVDDRVLMYHSGTEPVGVVGIARVSAAVTADVTALDPQNDHFDPKATTADPIWLAIEIELVEKFPRLIPLTELRRARGLAKMPLLARGQRLSVQPVSAAEFEIVERMAKPIRKTP